MLIRLLTLRIPIVFHWWGQVLLFGTMLFCGAFVFIHQWKHWAAPSRRAMELLPQVRAGDATIEELGTIRGGLAPLLEEVQGVMRDLRRQRAEIARLELEMSQRVASRTDALERSLGALRQQAAKDSLTGLNNRRALDVHLPQWLDRSRSTGLPLSLMMIDVDDFKLLNDTLGHAAGDGFLRSLGQLIRSTLRDNDLAFRYGGDEFVILLPGTAHEEAERISLRLISLVDGLGKTLRVARAPRLSMGLFSSLDLLEGANAEDFVKAADRLLYEAKQTRKVARRTTAA